MEDLEKRLMMVLKEHLKDREVLVSNIKIDTPFKNFKIVDARSKDKTFKHEFDSLEKYEFGFAIEEEFGIKIPDEKIIGFESLTDYKEYLKQYAWAN